MARQISPGIKYSKVLSVTPTGDKKGIAHIRKVTKLMRGGRLFSKNTKHYQEVTLDEKGAIVDYGSVVMDKEHVTETYDVELVHNADERLDTGFDNLMRSFRTNGVSPEQLSRLNSKWEMLSQKDKANVYDIYRENNNSKIFGSDTIDERAVMQRDSAEDYAKIFEQAINEAINTPDMLDIEE